jgi:hypothetical protein
MPRRIDEREPCGGDLSRGQVQRLRRSVVQRLHGWICMPCWIGVAKSRCCDMPSRHLQRVWRDGV